MVHGNKVAAATALAAVFLCCLSAVFMQQRTGVVELSSGQDIYRAWLRKSYKPKHPSSSSKTVKVSLAKVHGDHSNVVKDAHALGPDWAKHVDAETMRHYYYNIKTGESLWAHKREDTFPALPNPLPIVHKESQGAVQDKASTTQSNNHPSFAEFQQALRDCKDAKTPNCRNIMGVLNKAHGTSSPLSVDGKKKLDSGDDEGAADAAEVREALLKARGYRFYEDKQLAKEEAKPQKKTQGAHPIQNGVEAARKKLSSTAATLENQEARHLERRHDLENDLIFGWSQHRNRAAEEVKIPRTPAETAKKDLKAVAQQVGVLKSLAVQKAFGDHAATRGAVGALSSKGDRGGAVAARLRQVQDRLKRIAKHTLRGGKYISGEGVESGPKHSASKEADVPQHVAAARVRPATDKHAGQKKASVEGGKAGSKSGEWEEAARSLGAFSARR